MRVDGDERRIDGAYPLTTLQQGMLFHTLAAPEAGVYLQQLVCDVDEPLDTSAFRQAWVQLACRHDALRTSVDWRNQDAPLQLLHRSVTIPWQEQDWRGCPADEQRRRCEAFLRADRRRGFDLAVAPLFRLTLVRLGEARYQLLWTSHHLVLDGRSRLVLFEELFAIYDALCAGHEPVLAPATRLGAVVDWLQRRQTRPDAAFWQGAFAGLEQPGQLDFGVGSPGQPTIAVASKTARLSPDLSARLRALAADHRLTLNTLLQGAWAILLSHYTQQRSVVFGATRAGRYGAPPELARGVGLFINTLPVPVDVDPDARLLPWLHGLRALWVAQRSQEHISHADILDCIGAAPGTTLFDSLVSFENYELDARLRSAGGQWQRRRFRLHGQTNFPLVVSGYDAPGIRLEIEHDTRRFDDELVGRMLGHLQNVLRAFVERPDEKLSRIPLLGAAERHLLLTEWNDTAVAYPRECVHVLFERQVERTPEAVAVIHEDQALTYRALNARANRLAHHLIAMGVGADTLVGLCVERSPDLLVGILGILKAGGAYVPLDSEHPKQRLRFILDDAVVRYLVTQQTLVERLPANECRVVVLDRDAVALGVCSDANPSPDVGAESLAYVMYTSGSTGRPKGVQVPHGAVVNLLCGIAARPGLAATDRLLSLATVTFDISVLELLLPLTLGACVEVLGSELAADGAGLAAHLSARPPTVLQATPATWQMLIQSGWQGDRQLKALCGGEALPEALAAELLPRVGELWNLYGPTETTIWSTAWHVTDGQGRILMGRPLANTRVYVLDAGREPVPIGVPGELYIGGAGLARGYLERPALTEARFVAHPFDEDPAARLYRSGDLCRWRADGNLEFLGRLDAQVKLRGHRIETAEVEAVLDGHADIAQSVVVLREDRAGNKRLVAYHVSRSVIAPDVAALIGHMREALPTYMVPSAFVAMASLPLTPNGKVDRKALPAPDDAAYDSSTEHAAPRNELEQALTDIWSEVLGVERVGIHDDFFALGGHSLLATQVTVRIAAALSVDVSLRTLFDAPTIAELSTGIEALRQPPGAGPMGG